jgi:hypothetical protein
MAWKTVNARGEEGFADPLESSLVHTAAGIANRHA